MHSSLLLLCLLTGDPDVISTPVASITATSQGQPILEQSDGSNNRSITIALGQQIRLSSDKAVHANKLSSLLWNVEPKSTQTEVFPDGSALILTGPTVASTITVQQIVTLNDAITWQKLTIICGRGAQPPPTPIDGEPDPIPTPPAPVGNKRFFISLVSEAKLAKVDEANIRNSIAYWNNLKHRGHDWIFYDSITGEAKGIAAKAAMTLKGIQPPALVIDHDGKTISVIALPKSTAEIDSHIKSLGGAP